MMHEEATTTQLETGQAGVRIDEAALRAGASTAALRSLLPLLDGRVGSAHPTPPDVSAAVLSTVDQLERRLAVVLREHAGMADELLRVYEQIGVVFEVTRRLLTLSDEGEVAELFAESLRSTYPDADCRIVGTDDSVSSDKSTGSDSPPAWLRSILSESKKSRRVCVGEGSDDGTARASGEGRRVLVAPIFAGQEFVSALSLSRPLAGAPWESGDMQILDSLATFCGDAIRNFRLVQELQRMSMDMVRALVGAVDQKDPYTSGHSVRVGYYAMLLAKELGLGETELRQLEWSALLHDVGKIGIRDEVLKKQGKLTDEEFDHIKEHPTRGYEVVRNVPYMRDALDGVLHHHERFDGRGYPSGLKGRDIPLQARIIQTADIFDALTTTRSYRSAYDWRHALEILQKEAGTVVDPELCTTFVNLMNRCYARNPAAFDAIGTGVSRLELTGETAPTA